jgi:hypothetical protein
MLFCECGCCFVRDLVLSVVCIHVFVTPCSNADVHQLSPASNSALI